MTMKLNNFNLLIVSSNLYETWYTFNFEYLVEYLTKKIDSKKLFFLGKDRQGLNIKKIENLQDNDSFTNQLDIIIINFSDMHVYNEMYFSINLIKKLEKKCKIVFVVSDPWRFNTQIENYMDHLDNCIWLIHSDFFVTKYKSKFPNKVIKMLPYFVGEKYKNMMLKRKFDISFIGRCQIKNKKINLYKFRKYRVFHEGELAKIRSRIFKKKTVNKIFDIVINLNQSFFSYNSYPIIKGFEKNYHTPFRFVESGACGTLSIAPFITNELIKFYFPENLILNCNNSYSEIKKIIEGKDEKIFFEKSQVLSSIVNKNHKAKNRFEFILSLCNEYFNSEPVDFYEY